MNLSTTVEKMTNGSYDSGRSTRDELDGIRHAQRSGRIPGYAGTLVHIWKTQLGVAITVGLLVGTLIGVGEGIAVLVTQGLVGRYNELIAWAIAFDAPATVIVELGLAIISGVILSVARFVPVRRNLTAMQLGETAFVGTVAVGIWSTGMGSPALISTNWLAVLLAPAVAGILLGGLVLALIVWLCEHTPVIRRMKIGYWIVLEAGVVMAAVAYGFSR